MPSQEYDPVKRALGQALAALVMASVALEDAWKASDWHDEIELIEGLQGKADKLGQELGNYLDPPKTD